MAEGALADLRIVELATGVAGPYCGKLFADLGADVIKAEPPEGDRSRRHGPFPGDVPHPDRSGQFLYLNAGKRGIVLDLDRTADRTLLSDLLATADICITDLQHRERERLGLGYPALAAVNPRLILTAVTPFGDVGPYRDYSGTSFTTYHVGGLGWGTPHNEVTDPEHEPPLVAGGYLADYAAGITAASATLVGVAYRETYGRGQFIDISGMESIANAIRSSLGLLSANREPPPAPVRKKTGYPWVWPCKDGYTSLALQRDYWWTALKEMMGNPEWAQSELFDTGPGRMQYADAIEPLIVEWLMEQPKEWLFAEGLRRDLPAFPVYSIADLFQAEQFKVRGSLIEVDHPGVGAIRQPGPPARFSRTPATISSPAPSLGEHNEEVRREAEARPRAAQSPPVSHATGNLPLKGVRVADFGWILSVPHATAWLATLGAEVIRIESNASPDTMRATGMATGTDGIAGVNRSPGFNSLNFGKKSVTLNLKSAEGIALAKELVRISDVVTENFVVGTMQRAGLTYDVLREIRPDLIMLSGSTVGQTGPCRTATGWGPNSMAVAGVPFLTGYEGTHPSSVDATYPDFIIGVQMAGALLAALHERRRSGKGQYIDVAMAETIIATIPEAVIDYAMNGREGERRGNHQHGISPNGAFRCLGDDAWVAISVPDDAAWQGLRRALGDPAWAQDPAYGTVEGRLQRQDAIEAGLTAWTRDRENYAVMHALQAEGVAAAPVLPPAVLGQDPQLAALGYMVDVDHKEVGVRRVPGLPGRYSAMPTLDYRPTPLLGEHNEEVFLGLLGLSPDRYGALVEAKVIY